jgi:tetratricopeptide (TPR) repeat protein
MKDPHEQTGLFHLLNGRYGLAIGVMKDELARSPSEADTRLELACAMAAIGEVDEANAILSQYDSETLDGPGLARFRTAQAYAAIRLGDVQRASNALREAVSADGEFALAQFSLGRHLLFRMRDASEARAHLSKAADLEPQSRSLRLAFVGLEAQCGNYSKAMDAAKKMLGELGLEIRAILALVVSWVLSPSLPSRLFLIGCALSFFVPNVGPVVLVIWVLVGILSLILLRRVSPVLGFSPLLISIGLMIIYGVRSFLLGRWFP